MAASIAIATKSADAQAARWRTAFWTMWAVALVVKTVLAARLAPFGDEAWYWQESRHLALSYSDLPLATAWLIHAGESLLGHGVLGLRAAFLLLGAGLPIVLAATGRRLFGPAAGWQTGILTLLLPLTGTLGMFALPDVPLTFCTALAFDAFERAARTRAWRHWLALGLALAASWLCHYRAAMPMLAGLAFLAGVPRARTLWRERGLWLAAAIALAGALPLLVFNISHDWVALGFQLVDRNPWSFHADGLLQPLEQALICTPLFYGAMLVAAWQCARRARGGAPWDLLAACAFVPIIGYFVLGCFADDTRLRLHWALPGYLPLLIALPTLAREWLAARRTGRRWLLRATLALLVAGSASVYAYFALAAVPGGATALAGVKAFPEHWVGWNEVAQETQSRLAAPRYADPVLVADNFMLAAELDFALAGSRPVYALDHPLNAKHGRAPQLALWRLDEAGLKALGDRHLLLVSEPTTRRERERARWLATLCARVDELAADGGLELYGGRKRFLFFSARVRTAPELGANCADGAIR
jgi:4-amino-4-deoxy-L-arabinose transferase-like glycosyltransferase